MAIPLRRISRKRRAQDEVEEAPAATRRRLLRRPGKRIMASGLTAILVVAGAVVALLTGGTGEPTEARTSDLEFATVRRTDLVSVKSIDGEVASKEGPTIAGRLNGTITAMAAEGTRVDRGQPLYEVDGQPVVLMIGSVPVWRDIGGTITGEDVRQLEENLEALGYESGVVDETFTSTTTAAVKAWQDDLGLTEDGVVRMGRIVFAPAALTVDEQIKVIGASVHDGEEVLSTVSSERVVTVTLVEADDLSSGDEVSLVFAGERVPATVSSVDTDTTPGQDGSTSTIATIVPTDPNALADLADGADADAELVQESREDVLVVPVTALVARRGGGYAVEIERGASTMLVTVEPGLYADDLVEIAGDVKEGDKVVVP